MFTFAILDLNKRYIFVSRDQMGIKPLYIMQNNEMIFMIYNRGYEFIMQHYYCQYSANSAYNIPTRIFLRHI